MTSPATSNWHLLKHAKLPINLLPIDLGRIWVARRFTWPSNWWCEDHKISHGCQGQLAIQICWIWRHYLLPSASACNKILHSPKIQFFSGRIWLINLNVPLINRNIIDCMSDVVHHVGSSKPLKTSCIFRQNVKRHRSSSITKWAAWISWERFVLESNFTRHPCRCSYELQHQLHQSAFMELRENVPKCRFRLLWVEFQWHSVLPASPIDGLLVKGNASAFLLNVIYIVSVHLRHHEIIFWGYLGNH